MERNRWVPAAALGAVLFAAASHAASYQVVFERTWSSQTHPADFPLLAHFSPVIGATHGGGYELFGNGATATPGLERLCEEGEHQPLDEEIRQAIAEGTVGTLIQTTDPIRSAPGTASATFEIDEAHPMVSIAAMIAPSPDWCAAAPGVTLFENGAWVESRTVPLYAWDVGTDAASGYRALDRDQQPRGPVQLSQSPYFVKDGEPVQVGTVTYTLQQQAVRARARPAAEVP